VCLTKQKKEGKNGAGTLFLKEKDRRRACFFEGMKNQAGPSIFSILCTWAFLAEKVASSLFLSLFLFSKKQDLIHKSR
jgi:hypothetical protein